MLDPLPFLIADIGDNSFETEIFVSINLKLDFKYFNFEISGKIISEFQKDKK